MYKVSEKVVYYTVKEAAAYLGVTPATVNKYAQRGLIERHNEDLWGQFTWTVPGNIRYLIPAKSFEKFAEMYRVHRIIAGKPGKKNRKEVLV